MQWRSYFLCLCFCSNPKPTQCPFMGIGVGSYSVSISIFPFAQTPNQLGPSQFLFTGRIGSYPSLCLHLHILFNSQTNSIPIFSYLWVVEVILCLHLHFCPNCKPTQLLFTGGGCHTLFPPLFKSQTKSIPVYERLGSYSISIFISTSVHIPNQLNSSFGGVRNGTVLSPSPFPLLSISQTNSVSIY